MSISGLQSIKERFYRLVGSLSIEEILSNPPLIEKIKTISSLLVRATGQAERSSNGR
jgi:hypothetical protein